MLPLLLRARPGRRRRRTRSRDSSSASPRRRPGPAAGSIGTSSTTSPGTLTGAADRHGRCRRARRSARAASTSATERGGVGRGVLRLPVLGHRAHQLAHGRREAVDEPGARAAARGCARCRRRSRGGRSPAARCRAASRVVPCTQNGQPGLGGHDAAGDPQRRRRARWPCASRAWPTTGCGPRRAGPGTRESVACTEVTGPAPPSGEPGAGDVDPVQEVVGEQHVRHVVERRAGQRRQRLVVQVGDADDLARRRRRGPAGSRPATGGAQRPLWLTATRTPAASARASTPGSRARSSADRVSGFWASTCLPAADRRLDPVQPTLGPGGEVDVPHLGVGQQLLGAGVDAADEREPVPHRRRWSPGSGSRRRSRRRRTARTPAGGPTGRSVPLPRIATPAAVLGEPGRGVGGLTVPPGPPGSAGRPAGSRGRLGRVARRPPPRRRRRRRR